MTDPISASPFSLDPFFGLETLSWKHETKCKAYTQDVDKKLSFLNSRRLFRLFRIDVIQTSWVMSFVLPSYFRGVCFFENKDSGDPADICSLKWHRQTAFWENRPAWISLGHWWVGQGNRWARQPELQSGARRMEAQVEVRLNGWPDVTCFVTYCKQALNLSETLGAEFFLGGLLLQQSIIWVLILSPSPIFDLHPQAWVFYATKDSQRSRFAHRTSQTSHPPGIFVRPSSVTWGG